MSKIENPQAFPRTTHHTDDHRTVGGNAYTFTHRGNDGMTLRDWFAGQALGYLGLRKDITIRDASHIASISYELADAMLAERAKGGEV